MNSITELKKTSAQGATTKSLNLTFIEGNIGAGKSTVLEELGKMNDQLILIREPVDVWTTIVDEDGVNLLHRFYEEPPRWAFTFQLVAFVTRLQRLTDILDKVPENATVVMERSILSDRNCFATHGRNIGNISKIEWDIYAMWFDWFNERIPQIKKARYIYLKTDPKVAHERIIKRKRSEESAIPIEYLTNISKLHDQWFDSAQTNSHTLVVDELNPKEVAEQVHALLCRTTDVCGRVSQMA